MTSESNENGVSNGIKETAKALDKSYLRSRTSTIRSRASTVRSRTRTLSGEALKKALELTGVKEKPRSNLVSGANPEAIIQSSALNMRTQNDSVSVQETSGLDNSTNMPNYSTPLNISNQSRSYTQHLNSCPSVKYATIFNELNRYINKHQNRLQHHADLNAKNLANKGM